MILKEPGIDYPIVFTCGEETPHDPHSFTVTDIFAPAGFLCGGMPAKVVSMMDRGLSMSDLPEDWFDDDTET